MLYVPTPTQSAAAERHRAFHASIASAAERCGKGCAPVITATPAPVVRARDPIADAKAHRDLGGSSLDPRLAFANYAIGRSNTLAHAAARQIADARCGDPVMFNPLYIHAGVGLGKTHLLQAIALAGNSEDRKVLYLTAEKFVYSFTDAIRRQTALDFKQKLRGIDVLVIDDLQYLQGKSTQAEFCHTLNAALDAGRQVVFAADRLPSDLEGMEDRIRSRLASGLVVEIGRPSEDQRRDILQSRIEAAQIYHPGFGIPEPVRDLIARTVVNSGRDIEAAVNRLLAQSKLNDSIITLDMAEREIRDLVQPTEPKRIKIEDIQRIVARYYGVTRQDLMSARRTANIVRPRQIAVYLCRHLTLRSLPEIGRRFGHRDHTTQIYSIRKIASLCEKDTVLAAEITNLMKVIKDAANA